MFNKSHINAYKSICAPAELRQKVLEAKERKSKTPTRRFTGVATAAACMILTICILSAFGLLNNATEVLVDGQSPINDNVVLMGSNSVSLTTAREVDIITVPVSIDTDRNTIISVSCGTIVVSEAKSGEMIMTDTEYSVDENVSVLWQIPESELTDNNTMSVKNDKITYVLTLIYDEATDTRTVSCSKK